MTQTWLSLVVYGRPAPQGSKTFYGSAASGKGRFEESSKRVKPWREDVRAAALGAIEHCANRGCDSLSNGFPLDGPLVLRMVFTIDRPQNHYRTGRNAHLLRDTAPLRPAGVPDLSKLARSTEDALTSAGVWKDDARVVEYERLAKVYAGEDPDALDRPGVLIAVRLLTADLAAKED